MAYTETYLRIKETYPNLHVEHAYDGWDWIFSDGELIATYNDYTGEFVEIKEAV